MTLYREVDSTVEPRSPEDFGLQDNGSQWVMRPIEIPDKVWEELEKEYGSKNP